MSDIQQLTIFKVFCCGYNFCDKEYSSQFSLKRHVQIIHLKKKEVECELCHKTFRVMKNLIEHRYIHQNIKPYKCESCGKQFRHNSTFLAHKRNKECLGTTELSI